jgi:competence protein ComEC
MAKKRKKRMSKKATKGYIFLFIIAIIAIIYTVITENTDEEIILPDFLLNNTTETTVQEITTNSTNVINTEDESNIETTNTNDSNTISTSDEDVEIYFFDVGQADCILIKQGENSMLIDAGNNADGKLITNYLKNDLKLSSLNYVVGTHSHEDHIGGLDEVIEGLDIGKVYMPFVSETSTKTYENVENAVLEKGLEITNPTVGEKFSLGNATLEVMYVDNTEPSEKNDQSIVLQMTYGNEKYLFMGDAETTTEKARSWEKVNVLKVGHHGSSTSSSEAFLKQVSPEIAIVSVGPNNTYNLPKETILNRIAKYATIYRTDESGTILLTSDGTKNNIQTLSVCLDGNSR